MTTYLLQRDAEQASRDFATRLEESTTQGFEVECNCYLIRYIVEVPLYVNPGLQG
jgi:hypothetical protein